MSYSKGEIDVFLAEIKQEQEDKNVQMRDSFQNSSRRERRERQGETPQKRKFQGNDRDDPSPERKKTRKDSPATTKASKDGEQGKSHVVLFNRHANSSLGEDSKVQKLGATLTKCQTKLQFFQKCEQDLLQMSGLPEEALELAARSLRGVNVELEVVRCKALKVQKEVDRLLNELLDELDPTKRPLKGDNSKGPAK